MDRNPFPRRIRFVFLLLVAASSHLHSAVNVIAQSRAQAGLIKETPSQRYLPLPQFDSVAPRQQMEWLKQLKGDLSANSEASELSALRGLSADDVKALQAAIRQSGVEAALRSIEKSGSLPSGLVPEQVSKAIADPAMREKLKRALDQFAGEDKRSGGSASNGSNGVPFPTDRPSPKRADSAAPQTKSGSDSTPNDASPPHQRIVPSSEGRGTPSNRQSNGPDGKNVPEVPEPLPGEPSLPPQRLPLRGTDAASNLPKPSQSIGKGIPSGNRNLIPSENAPPPSPGSSAVPSETAGSSMTDSQKPTDSNERLNGRPGTDSGSSTSIHAKRTAPVVLPNRDRRTNANRPSGSATANPETAPVASLPDAGRDNSMDSRKAMNLADFKRQKQSSRPLSSNATGSPSASKMIPPDSPSDQKPSSFDVRTGLEQHGFAATLRQLVDEARRGAESEIAAQRQSNAARNDPSSSGGRLAGLHDAVASISKDAGNDISVVAPRTDSNPSQMTPLAGTPVAPAPAAASSSEPTSPISSVLSRVSKAADQALSPITPSEPTQKIPRGVNGTISPTPDGPKVRSPSVGSVMWLGVLLVLLTVGWYAATWLTNSMFVSSQSPILATAEIRPAEIGTRRDIVRAFHQFALRPMMPVADWWTHRQVAQQLATSTPSLEPAIQQLAELYEQARYLPDETVFTADQIGTARRAFEQCQTRLASGS